MEPSLVETVERWEQSGARSRVVHLSEQLAVVELLTCYGEPVDRLSSHDRGFIDWLAARAEPAAGGEP